MRFAVELGRSSAGATAHHISGTYGIHLRRRRGWTGGVFKHYVAIPIDSELFLDELVLWLHRLPESTMPEGLRAGADGCWTADSAYMIPKFSTWITTGRVLAALSPGGAGRSVYIRRKLQPIAPEIAAILTSRATHRSRHASNEELARLRTAQERPSIEEIIQFVAEYNRLSYEELCSASRKRTVSKAKVVAAVLCTRNGASVAAVARLFGRGRSTLIEQAECYRENQPQLFIDAERALDTYLGREPSRHDSPVYPARPALSRPSTFFRRRVDIHSGSYPRNR
jgi:hypothetical protein